MAQKILFFDNTNGIHKAFADTLRFNGYVLVDAKDLGSAEKIVSDSDFFAVVYAGSDTSSWQICQNLLIKTAHLPVVYIMLHDDPREENIAIDELSQIVRPLSDRKKFLNILEQVGRVGRLHRVNRELSALGSGISSIENMFSRLDVHHILDRVLSYFGTRLEVENIHWIRWSEIPHIMSASKQDLFLELELPSTRSPKMMSYRDCDVLEVCNWLTGHLQAHGLNTLIEEQSQMQKSEGKQRLIQIVPSPTGGQPLGVIIFWGLIHLESREITAQISQSLKLMSRFVLFGLEHWDIKNLSMTDELTSLFNQRYLPIVLENEISRAQRRSAEFSILFLDLDWFKKVNDSRGHWIGSKLLAEVGKLIRSKIRSCDFGFRYGGDEFVVVLPDTPLNGGQIVAERIRNTIESARFLIDGHDIQLTASIGLASFPTHGKTREQLIQLADQAMYFGKRKSRNIVYIAS